MRLTRVTSEPILKSIPEHAWEAAAVFNCGIIEDRGLIHMIYRATDTSSNGADGIYINNFGYAVSEDGVNFNRLEKPILINDIDQELRGPEDPRIVKIEDTFYMLYTGYGGRFGGDFRISLATSKNLIKWERQGIMLDEPNKDAALFPEKINDRYMMFHRRSPSIWLASSSNLIDWDNHQFLMGPTDNEWESKKIGIGGPPIKTNQGWILIYHGVSEKNCYSLGIALLDLEDPTKVIARQSEPILEPELAWEIDGYVPNVVFSCGQAIKDDKLLVYYAGADTAIGVAEIPLNKINF